ncbi:MAG: hypothetical protein KF900_08120 [Bacteroidetes bacterium]|nr:hypothetical protein [Bacteroidota bacterium]
MEDSADLYQDLRNFMETKRNITEFIKYRMAHPENSKDNQKQIAEYRAKAISALNNLFSMDIK